MIVYRLSKSEYINDLTGTGAFLSGGRWNKKGTFMIYTSESRALASLEFLVHVSMSMIPPKMQIASVQIPDSIKPVILKKTLLPTGWYKYPPPPALARIGSDWIEKNSSLLLRVPSALVRKEFNILINPGHPDMKKARIKQVENFSYDQRLLSL